jgi:hypothetical protein
MGFITAFSAKRRLHACLPAREWKFWHKRDYLTGYKPAMTKSNIPALLKRPCIKRAALLYWALISARLKAVELAPLKNWD